jgi:ATP-binding cassette, subfamily B, bacterial MsbA
LKTFRRILTYAPVQQFILPYFSFAILASAFNILTFSLLQTLLDVLFLQKQQNSMVPSGTINHWISRFNNYIQTYLASNGTIKGLWLVCGILVGSILISNIFRYLAARIIETVKGFTVYSIRKTLYHKAVQLPLSFYNQQRKGDIITRFSTDIQEVETSLGKAFSALFKDLILLVFYFVVLFWRSWQLTLFAILIIPISGFVISSITKKLREKASNVQKNQSLLMSLFDETFGGIKLIQSLGAEAYMQENFDNRNKSYFKSWLKMVFRQELAPPVSEILGILLVAALLLYGGSMVLNGSGGMSASAFVSYILLFSQVTRPVKEISNALTGIQRGTIAAERILEIIDTPNTLSEKTNAVTLETFSKTITLENVRFSYEPETEILKGINLTIPKGKTYALVGSSGSGKSTLSDLMCRFYDVTHGSIKIDGLDLRDLKTKSLNNLFGVVSQESVLFNDTIKNNVLFGYPVSQKDLWEALSIANATEFINQLPDGLETNIGDRGELLSGGQRQRLNIARAILRKPEILLLDEATSALDTESEALVQEALQNVLKGRTALIIAHRLSTIKNADQIIVMDQGQIVEQGTHAQLLNIPNGQYAKLNNIQGANQ